MEHLPIQKVTISGPTLSSLINRFTSSAGPTSGLLFGQFTILTPTTLTDDDTLTPSSLTATLTGFSSSSSPSPSASPTRHVTIGHFSARRLSPLRPSLLDHSRSHSLSLSSTSPSLFLLLTTPLSDSPSVIHTHDYRAYVYRASTMTFEAVSLEVVNIGPGFRAQYGNFSPISGLPALPCGFKIGSPMREDRKEGSLMERKRAEKDEKDLEGYVAEGYDVGSLSRLMGGDAVGYMGGVEELYEKMLGKLESLARVVESSNARVLELENHNVKLRRKVAGIE